MYKLIINLIYPPKCVFCGKRLSPKVAKRVCSECANTLPYARIYNRCSRCGRPISGTASRICKDCSLTKSHITRSTAPFLYTDIARNGVLMLKREANSSNAITLSEYIVSMIRYDFKNVEFDYVVSAPLRKKSSNEQGYNHAGKLASNVALRLGIPYLSGALYHKGRIRKQSSLSIDDRIENVKGKFALRKPSIFKGKTVLVVDDVRTSGSTLNECARVLKESGAYRVYGATLTTVPGI